MGNNITKEDLGYTSFFESHKDTLELEEYSVARVISENRGAYQVKNEHGEFLSKITGKHIFEATSREDYPAVGDWVAITELGDDRAVIHQILPRYSIIKRTHGDRNKSDAKNDVQVIATNIDVAFVIESVDRDYNLNRFERYFTLLRDGGVEPVIILNKTDLLSPEDKQTRLRQLQDRFPDIDILMTSTVDSDGLDALRAYITKGKTYCFLGSSGVGKSSLINTLLGKDLIKTGDISSYSGRGKHVTTVRQMYVLESGGIVIDNPGIREVGIVEEGEGINTFFDDIVELAQHCKYTDCTHTHEPDCAVIQAVESGELDEEKYNNYINLKKESEYYDMNALERREKDRQFGKFVKSAKKGLRDIGHKDI